MLFIYDDIMMLYALLMHVSIIHHLIMEFF